MSIYIYIYIYIHTYRVLKKLTQALPEIGRLFALQVEPGPCESIDGFTGLAFRGVGCLGLRAF